MRPIHIGLLVVGAALAGGLAVRMSRPPLLPVVAPAPIDPLNAAPSRKTPAPVAATAPPEVSPQPAKPSPIPPLPLEAPPAHAIRIDKPKPAPVQAVRIESMPPREFPPMRLPEPSQPAAKTPAPDPKPAAPLRQVILRAGAMIAVRLDESLSSERNAGGDTFSASLTAPIVANGLVIAERGARVTGRVVNSQRSGLYNGTSFLQLGLGTFTTSDGQRVPVATETWARRGEASRGEYLARIGGGAILGAVIGAAAGGERGAAIGVGAGSLAGVGVAIVTSGRPVTVPSETVIRFRLASPVTITELQNP